MAVTVTLSHTEVVTSVLAAQAVFLNEPASMSAWVMVWVPVQVIEAPGARSAGLDGKQVKLSRPVESVTVTACCVVLPVLVVRTE